MPKQLINVIRPKRYCLAKGVTTIIWKFTTKPIQKTPVKQNNFKNTMNNIKVVLLINISIENRPVNGS